MLTPDTRVDVKDGGGLHHWAHRCTTATGRPMEYYLRYRGVNVTVHPARAARVEHNGLEVTLDDTKKYRGKGWDRKLCADIEQAVDKVLAGQGEEVPLILGNLIRKELARRTDGREMGLDGPRPPGQRLYWFEWLNDDELKLLLGAWLGDVGVAIIGYTITRQPILGYTPEDGDLDLVSRVGHPSIMIGILQRLVDARIDDPERSKEVFNVPMV